MDNIRDIEKRILTVMKDDRSYARKFENDPAGLIEEVLGIELDENKLNAVVKSVKEKKDSNNFGFGDIMDNEILPGKLPD